MAHILVVDDEPAIRAFLTRLLEREGHQVQPASDGREALHLLDQAPFDLLLTDIKMEGMDGVHLLEHSRAHFPDLAVILLTGHATVASAVAALRHGAHNYLLKPAKNEEIVSAVDAALRERDRQQRRDRLERLAEALADVVQPAMQAIRPGEAPGVVAYAGLSIDPVAYTATLEGVSLDLTPTEFRLLLTLVSMPGRAFDYVALVQAACGYTCARHEAQEIIGTHVRNLRGKLGVEPGHPLHVQAVRGIGYRLTAAPATDY